MTGTPSATRKPYDPAPYASLRSTDGNGTAPRQAADTVGGKEGVSGDFTAEGERLKALREALWAAFEAGPEAGLPNTLIDLTMAYTGSLRLQLNLRAIASRQHVTKPKVSAHPRPAPSAKE